MSNPNQASPKTKIKVGLVTVLGLLLIAALSFYVNDRPFWWKPCRLVHVNVEDATGLKMKSPIRSLGLDIGYLEEVELSETYVHLAICLTAPVEILPETRAYIRAEGFLGDKFVELKPVRYFGEKSRPQPADQDAVQPGQFFEGKSKKLRWFSLLRWVVLEANAENSPRYRSGIGKTEGPEIPVGQGSGQDVQKVVNQVDTLVREMTELTANLKEALNPAELRQTIRQLNRTLENASRVLSPEGNLNTTAQRTLAKLEDAIEQLRDQITRINQGQGSLGKLLNDPVYAEEILIALKNVNGLLNKVQHVRFVVDLGVWKLAGYDTTRGAFSLGIWPTRDRYYLLGVSFDSRGKSKKTTTTTVAGGISTTTETTQVEDGVLGITAMLGKVFWRRLDLSAGFKYGDGAASVAVRIGPHDREELAEVRNDIYSRGSSFGLENRTSFLVRPWLTLYLQGGVETWKRVNGKMAYFYGAGVSFDDEDIKLLFAFR